MSSIPSDILCNVLLFLSRFDIEKIQLICQSWRSIIDRCNSLLPIRLILKLELVGDVMLQANSNRMNFAALKSKEFEELEENGYMNFNWEERNVPAKFFASLKNSVVKNMVVKRMDFEMVNCIFLHLLKINQEKLHIFSLELNTIDSTIFITYQQALDLLNHIQVDKLIKSMSYPEEQDSLYSPDIILPLDLPKIILSYDWNRQIQRMDSDYRRFYAYMLDNMDPPSGPVIEKLIHREIKGVSSLNLVFPCSYAPMEMVERIMRVYHEEEDPKKLFRSIKIMKDEKISGIMKEFVMSRSKESQFSRETSLGIQNVFIFKPGAGHRVQFSIQNGLGRHNRIEYVKIKVLR